MKSQQSVWSSTGWSYDDAADPDSQLVLVFGGRENLTAGVGLPELRQRFPKARLVGCSTAGEICATSVMEDSLVATAVHFDHTRIETTQASLADFPGSHAVGEELARRLVAEDLVHVFVLSDGINVNGSELVAGLTSVLPANVTLTGGLSGDGDRFEQTLVLGLDKPHTSSVVATGLYSRKLHVGCASLGGWDTFGPERRVTRSNRNVLYELDGRSALALYKDYLAEHAAGLPATGLLFPLALRATEDETPVVRTILGIDEDEHSLTFAGDIPQGSLARLMHANFDRLVDGAAGAARESSIGLENRPPDLAILISCVGRKMILKQRIEEEIEAVRDIFGPDTVLTGFYSYGEISPFTPNARCELHNQTMTITAFREDTE